MNHRRTAAALCLAPFLLFGACAEPLRDPGSRVLDTGSLVMYQVNVRQFSEAGTFDAFRAHLPRLADMGVGGLWLMPIHPIGEEERKGSLGSPYAARDYLAVNPEFGDEEDFRQLVDAAHEHGMFVILDWVANHTAWDHVWTAEAPGRYRPGEGGGFAPPNDDWSDVIQLEFDAPGTGGAMSDAMAYWVTEFGVDGFRADVAELVPEWFWRDAIERLRDERPQFMLAEGGAAWLHGAGFDATYGWGLGDTLLRVASGEADARDVRRHVEEDGAYIGEGAPGAFRMHFTTNHDWNSWNGVALERFGPSWGAATVLTFTLPGIPLIYNGQEAGLSHRLAFFEKDEIVWRPDPAAELYRRLAALKREEPALRHGPDAGALEFLEAGDPARVLAFRRSAPGSEVLVMANLSDQRASVRAPALAPGAAYTDLRGFPAAPPASLGPWEWAVLRRAR